MAQEIIDIGTSSDSGDGTPNRTAWTYTNNNFTELYNGVVGQKHGFFDYNDSLTSTTPISVTGGAGFVDITNDGAGTFTNKTYAPLGVTDVWDGTLNTFDWSELSLGDMVDIRIDLLITTTSVNTSIEVDLFLGDGAGLYQLPFITSTNLKDTGTYGKIVYNGIYMGDTNTLNNGGVFKVSADKDCSVVVNGWYCKIVKR